MKAKVIKIMLLILIFVAIFKVGLFIDPKLKDAHVGNGTSKEVISCK